MKPFRSSHHRTTLWKLLLSLALAAWAISELVPFRDAPSFSQYAQEHAAREHRADFRALLAEAADRVHAGQAVSDYVALERIAHERRLDLARFFPDIRLESSLHNLDRRNDLVLGELLRRSKARLQRGLDLAGGVAITLELEPGAANPRDARAQKDQIAKAIEIIGARVNALGVAEPIIRPIGSNRIEVQLPGLDTKTNPEVVDQVKKPARLEFRTVHPTLAPGPGVEAPPGYEILREEHDTRRGETYSEELFVKRVPEMTGAAIERAFARTDRYGRAEVLLRLTPEGAKQFAELTRRLATEGREHGQPGRLAIVLDGKLASAPTVQEEITGGSAQITGSFSERAALDLASVLNNPLDVPLVVKEQHEVGPSLARDAIASGVRASVIGTTLVAAFMITFYATAGLVAVATLGINLLIILGVMASLGATMTLPGLAGIVLTVGMAVDANILIFERVREELAAGKSLAAANQGGYTKALGTILDAHCVQLIICAIMIWLGTGPIKGFGVTLAIGVVSTLFSVLLTAHVLMEWLIGSGWLRTLTMRRLLRDVRVDFVKWGKPAFVASWLVVLLGVAVVLHRGGAIYGIDFTGGDVVSMRYRHEPDLARVRAAAQAIGVKDVHMTKLNAIGGGQELLSLETPEGKGAAVFAAAQRALPEAGLEQAGQAHVGAAMGREIEWNALLAVGVSMATILGYIAFRFELGFGVGAVFSTLHDILMTIGVFVLTGRQFNAPMVAAILCIAGYSINETVVVFDRIREELKLNPTGKLRDIVNDAIRKVFARTIMTASTTFLAALALFVFGGGVLRDISFTFLVGIATSTFSAIFVAAQVFYWWHRGDRRRVEADWAPPARRPWESAGKASPTPSLGG